MDKPNHSLLENGITTTRPREARWLIKKSPINEFLAAEQEKIRKLLPNCEIEF